jgi:hypothetical protein
LEHDNDSLGQWIKCPVLSRLFKPSIRSCLQFSAKICARGVLTLVQSVAHVQGDDHDDWVPCLHHLDELLFKPFPQRAVPESIRYRDLAMCRSNAFAHNRLVSLELADAFHNKADRYTRHLCSLV